MKRLLSSNEARFRLARTIIQGVIGVLIANADYLFSTLNFEPEAKAFIVALTMAILSPVMAELGRGDTEEMTDEEAQKWIEEDVTVLDDLAELEEGGDENE